MADLLLLAEDCERVPEPERSLDGDIAIAIGWTFQKMKGDRQPYYRRPGDTEWFMRSELPKYTSSIDAALTVIPEGWFFSGLDQQPPAVRVWTEGNIAYHSPGLDGLHAATPALAICAAALRAHARLLADVGQSGERQ